MPCGGLAIVLRPAAAVRQSRSTRPEAVDRESADVLRPRLPAADRAHRGRRARCRGIELVSADGTRFAAYLARAAEPSGAGIVILPDVRGLHTYYRSSHCASPSTASMRSPSTTSRARQASAIGSRVRLGAARPADHVRGAARRRHRCLRAPAPGHRATRIHTIGFCMGGGSRSSRPGSGSISRASSASTAGRSAVPQRHAGAGGGRPPRSRARSWPSSAAPTRASRPRRLRPSRPSWRAQASTTAS